MTTNTFCSGPLTQEGATPSSKQLFLGAVTKGTLRATNIWIPTQSIETLIQGLSLLEQNPNIPEAKAKQSLLEGYLARKRMIEELRAQGRKPEELLAASSGDGQKANRREPSEEQWLVEAKKALKTIAAQEKRARGCLLTRPSFPRKLPVPQLPQ
jgi:hypothetical protein